MIAASDFLPDVWPHFRRCPDFMIERQIAQAAQKFLRETSLWRETLMVLAAPGSRDIDLPHGDDWRAHTVLSASRVPGGPLDAVAVERIGGSECGIPTGYAVLSDRRIRLNRSPDELVRIAIEAALVPTGDNLPAFLTDYRDEIVAGTLARLYAQKAETWADPLLADQYESQFRNCIATARFNAARGNSGAELRVRIPRL